MRMSACKMQRRVCSGLPDQASLEMVVDGATLTRILGTDAEPLLARLADQCSGVVVCRASPSQKAAIVRLMKVFQAERLRPVRPPPACCPLCPLDSGGVAVPTPQALAHASCTGSCAWSSVCKPGRHSSRARLPLSMSQGALYHHRLAHAVQAPTNQSGQHCLSLSLALEHLCAHACRASRPAAGSRAAPRRQAPWCGACARRGTWASACWRSGTAPTTSP